MSAYFNLKKHLLQQDFNKPICWFLFYLTEKKGKLKSELRKT